MTKDEKDLNKIMKTGGVIMIIMGLLSIWRGIFRLMPFAGFQYGLVFSLFGGAIAILGIIFLIHSLRKEKKWKQLLAEQGQEGKTDEEA